MVSEASTPGRVVTDRIRLWLEAWARFAVAMPFCHNLGVTDFGELVRPSHSSKMVLSTVNLGPPKGIRTGCLTVRRICSLIHLFRWLVIWSSRSRISPLNLDSIQLDCPRSTAKFRCYCLTDRKLLPSPMEHREAAQQTFAMSPCRLVAPGTAPLGAS